MAHLPAMLLNPRTRQPVLPAYPCPHAECPEVRYVLPRSNRRNANPPLLFVHGAYCDAWCWEVHPWLPPPAIPRTPRRGHGKSPAATTCSLHLADYMDDIRSVVAELPARPVPSIRWVRRWSSA
jgi:pimeloyl-ACP methyl ester carboxylesterase